MKAVPRLGDIEFPPTGTKLKVFMSTATSTVMTSPGLGFCAVGESGAYIDGGDRIRLGGDLPLNTDGGQLSAGRLHGFGHVYEAVAQLRGDCGDRQVPGAEVAVVSNGGGHISGCMLLTKGA